MYLIDLSHEIVENMPVYPGDDSVRLGQTHKYSKDHYNNHWLETGMHVGTHVDGAMHMTDVCEYICNYPLEKFYGSACVIHTYGKSVLEAESSHTEVLKDKSIVLVHTGMDRFYGQETYYKDHPVLGMSFCEMLVNHGIKLVGIDAPSPDRLPFEIHKYLLGNNILLLENLTNMDKIPAAVDFEVMAFPLKIRADSCMVRAVAKVMDKNNFSRGDY
ncbi:cyclase family protein [Ruminiclostridium cellulolyticum]|uniref:Cyclase family protein n=1 Tax=Ruminiclostridium cellulolyticum (strain ATCC 35319 / DSM 5812 / JCM 6584 / H10) TaxID=394503 RepID=B8I373_RUMCH|nr:cyclase family protein [Ruminiclostridium cellulolyticum]ACL76216.1 cyclase family protein [Ruminiclostridium cellulolyticum H10]